MSVSRKILCQVYGLIAVLAFVGTWGNNFVYLHLGFFGSQKAIWRDSLINPAGRSNTVDLAFFGLAVFIWMILEARRLGMRGIWIYALFFMIAGISVSGPVFLINRERALASRDTTPVAGTLSRPDVAGLIAGAVAVVVYTVALLFMTWN
jgi:hypothetical protein